MRRNQHAILDIAKVIWLKNFSDRNLMATLHAAYLDASGKVKGYAVLTVGGVISPIRKLQRFESEWGAILNREGVSEFHATDFAASQGEYKDWRGDKHRRSKFLYDLGEVVKKNINKLFMVNVEIDAWNEVNRDYLLEEVFYHPYALAGYTAIKQIMKWAEGKHISLRRVKFIFEDGDDGWEGLKKLANRAAIEPIRLPKTLAIPCQAADMIAWKSRIAFTNALHRLGKIENVQYADFENFRGLIDEWSSLEKALKSPGTPGVYGREALIRTCKRSGVIKRSEWLKIKPVL